MAGSLRHLVLIPRGAERGGREGEPDIGSCAVEEVTEG